MKKILFLLILLNILFNVMDKDEYEFTIGKGGCTLFKTKSQATVNPVDLSVDKGFDVRH